MKIKQIFLLCMWGSLLLYCTYDQLPRYFNTALVNYQFAEASFSRSTTASPPPVEKRKVKKKQRKKNATKKHKKKFKGIKDKAQVQKIKPGFIVMLAAGVTLAVLAIYLGTLLFPWSAGLTLGCSTFFATLVLGALAWVGWVILCLVALALIINGIIWTVYFSRKS